MLTLADVVPVIPPHPKLIHYPPPVKRIDLGSRCVSEIQNPIHHLLLLSLFIHDLSGLFIPDRRVFIRIVAYRSGHVGKSTKQGILVEGRKTREEMSRSMTHFVLWYRPRPDLSRMDQAFGQA